MSATVFAVGFMVWRRMRAEYHEEQIIVLNFWLLLGGLLGGSAAYLATHLTVGLADWGIIIGIILMLAWRARKMEWDFWEWLDGLGIYGYWLGAAGYALGGEQNLIYIIPILLGLVVVAWVGKYYRRIRWYRSGKMGFTGLFSLIYWSLLQIIIAIFIPSKLYWLELSIEQWVYALILTWALVMLYARSGRKLTEELRLWPNKRERMTK